MFTTEGRTCSTTSMIADPSRSGGRGAGAPPGACPCVGRSTEAGAVSARCGAPPKNFGKTAVPSVPPTRAAATTRISSAPGVEFRRMSESLLEEDVLIITTDGNPGTGKQGNAQKIHRTQTGATGARQRGFASIM